MMMWFRDNYIARKLTIIRVGNMLNLFLGLKSTQIGGQVGTSY